MARWRIQNFHPIRPTTVQAANLLAAIDILILTMPKTLISVDPKKEPWNQGESNAAAAERSGAFALRLPHIHIAPASLSSFREETPLHNRWHPDIPPVAKVEQGEKFRVECVDWTGGQIKDNDSSDDVKNVDLSQVHYLSGPIEVEGAKASHFFIIVRTTQYVLSLHS